MEEGRRSSIAITNGIECGKLKQKDEKGTMRMERAAPNVTIAKLYQVRNQ